MANQYIQLETAKKEEEDRRRKGDVSGAGTSALPSQASQAMQLPNAVVTSNDGPLDRLSDEDMVEENKEDEISITEGKVTYTNKV